MHRLFAFVCLCTGLFAQQTPRLTGAFFQFATMDQAGIDNYLREMHSLGEDTLITVGTITCKGQGVAPLDAQYDWLERANIPILMGHLLAVANSYGIKVYLGAIEAETCTYTPQQIAAETGKVIDYYLANFGGYPALAGWYIGDEAYIQDPRWISSEVPYFAGIVQEIRKRSSLPILESPYLVNQWPGDPNVAAATAKQFIDATGIDILVYEDGMSCRSGANLGINTYPNIGDYFAAIGAAVGRQHLWAIHEAELEPCVTSDGVSSISRINRQISLVPDSAVSGRVLWTQQYYMTDTSLYASDGASRLLAQYRATHGFGPDTLLPINEILWLAPTSPAQGYFSPTLKDGLVGDPFWDTDPQWVSVSGNSAFYVDLFQSRTVDWINLYVARQPEANVKIPAVMVAYCSEDGLRWSFLGYWDLPQGTSSERDIGTQQQPLGAKARFLWVYLGNDATTKISEVEVVGR